jgi:antitoxin ParD1/3/4
MNAKKLSVTIDCKNKSEVIKIAIKLLRQKELEDAYRLANKEIDDAFDNTAADGL